MQLAADFEVDPRDLQWKVSLHFLLRKRDVQALMVTVLLMKLQVSADKLPGRTKPFTALAGGGAAIRYADELVHRRDSNGVVSHHSDSSWPGTGLQALGDPASCPGLVRDVDSRSSRSVCWTERIP